MKFDGEYELFYSKEKDTSLKYSDNEIKVKESTESAGYSIRVIKDKKIGFSYGEDAAKLSQLIESAQKVAQFGVASEFSFAQSSKYPKLALVDKKIEALTTEQLKEFLYDIKAGVEKYTKNARVHLSSGNTIIEIENSNQLEVKYDQTGISVYVEATEQDGFGYSVYASHFLPKNFTQMGEEAGSMAKSMQNPKKKATGKYMVVFEPEAISDILEVLLPSFSGDWKRREITSLGDKINKKVFDEKVSIYDDATASASSARPCDDEGVISRKIPLVEKGIVKNFLYDRTTAALSNVDKEGACNRNDFTSLPTLGNSNTVINAGEVEDFEDELKTFLLVKSLHGTHTANTTTGDFGVEVNIAWDIQKDKKMPVRGFILSGNIFTLFSTIYGLEKKQAVYGHLITPRIAFENIQVVG